MNNLYLEKLRNGEALNFKQCIQLVLFLSFPAILAQLSSVVMQYIDSSMVGQLGVNEAASIALVSSTTWLFGGVANAMGLGFSVQIAHYIGAREEKKARNIMKMGLIFVLLVGILLMMIGLMMASPLPLWLKGPHAIRKEATLYFMIYAASLPAIILVSSAGAMLQGCGNMKIPSLLNILMCLLDVIFNALFIFPSGRFFPVGFNLGVAGASLGTALSQVVIALVMVYFLLFKEPLLKIRMTEKTKWHLKEIKKALSISLPVAFESIVMSGAYIMSTRIVSPLGTLSIATHSFSITVESLCYMPGYGLGAAATTLIGQSIGAKRKDLTHRFAWLTTILGMLLMGVMGILLFFMAPFMLSLLSPHLQVQQLGTSLLRIEAFVEALYGASIVANGVFRGNGDTFIPSVMNLTSMWFVRIPLAYFLSLSWGLKGVWIAMAFELCFRGTLFLIRLSRKYQMKEVKE